MQRNEFCACQDLYHKAYHQETVYNLHKLKIINHCPSVLPLKEVALYIQFRSDFTANAKNNGKSLDTTCKKFQSEYLDSSIFRGWKPSFSKAFCDLYYYYEYKKQHVYLIKHYENWMFYSNNVVIKIRNYLKPYSWFLTTW